MNHGFLSRFLIATSLALLLASCSDRDDPPKPPPPPVNPLEAILEEGSLVLDGVQEGTLNPAETTLRFALKNTRFDAAPGEITLRINGKPVDPASLQIMPDAITASVKLDDGKNDIVFKAYDEPGRPLHMVKTVWAGSNTLTVNVVDSSGVPVAGAAQVKLQLSDDPAISRTVDVSGGKAVFANVPGRTVVLEARTPDNSTGTAGAVGSDGSVTLRLMAFRPPSQVDNNDFSQGLDGYEYGNSPVSLAPHVEAAGPAQLPPAVQASAPAMSRKELHARLPRAVQTLATAAGENMDASLETSGQGPQHMSRSFTVKPGTSSVSVRYRFITSEVPGGYFGSRYNDYYSVSIRTQSGGAVTESNTMNGLGLAAFDAVGSTSWKTVKLPVEKAGDLVQVDMTVANVADDMLDSVLVIDFIAEKDEVTPSLAWDANEGGLKLGYKVGQTALAGNVDIQVFWASGPALANRIGEAITTVTVPAGTAAGTAGTRNIPGSLLQDNPAGATHLVSAVGEDAVGPVADVSIVYGPNADSTAVSAQMADAVKDGARNAGNSRTTISRTAVTPADQARAMFQNLVRPPGPLAANIATQRAIYAPPGDAVIGVFESQTQGMTLAQASANAATIQAAMTNAILAQGPSNVSKHCADPATISVVDVPLSNFSANGRTLFRAIAAARSRLLEENNVYHMEIQLGNP